MVAGTEFARIYNALTSRYSLQEFRTICATIGVSYDQLAGEDLGGKVRELILYLSRRNRLGELTPFLILDTTPTSHLDLAIVTAMPEELTPVLNLIGGKDSWKEFLLDNYVHYQGVFTIPGGSLNVVACSLWQYGGNPTTAAVIRLKSLQPRLIAMTGICAGWESKDIAFGDVIVADRAFYMDEGKLSDTGFEPDTRTYQPTPWLLQWLNNFASNTTWATKIATPRPRSLRYQADWLLCQLAILDRSFPQSDEDWQRIKDHQIDYQRTSELLQKNGMLLKAGSLSRKAKSRLAQLRQENYGQLIPTPDPALPRSHYGAFASTTAIIAVSNPFFEPAQRVRKVRAIELEVASLFSAANEIGIPAFAVKGVSDFATPEKDDAFHQYAAEASAQWMYHFMQDYGHLLHTI